MVPSVFPDPGCTTLCQVLRGTQNNHATEDKYIMVCYTPSDLRGVVWRMAAAQAVNNADCQLLQVPAFSSATAAATATNQPSHIRPGRLGIRIRNTSTPTATSGFIRVLNTSQQVIVRKQKPGVIDLVTGVITPPVNVGWEINGTPALQLNPDAQNQIKAIMDTDPNVRTITSYDLLEERQFSCLPTSESYHIYDDYRQGVLQNPNAYQSLHSGTLNTSETKAAMAVLIIQIPSASTIQLNFTVMTDDVVRFPANSTLSYLHKNPSQWSQEGFASQVAHARGLDGRTSR